MESGTLLLSWPHGCSWEHHSTSGSLKRKGSHSAFADGLPNGSLLTINDFEWIKEKCCYDLAALLRTLPLTVRFRDSLKSSQVIGFYKENMQLEYPLKVLPHIDFSFWTGRASSFKVILCQ